MTTSESRKALQEYAQSGSESAFRSLVNAYTDLVYSTAFRMAGNSQPLAEDITQEVFAQLARKAPTLSPGVMLGGWLHRHTCFVAAKTVRTEQRRQNRERQAVEMNSLTNDSEDKFKDAALILDRLINELETEERDLVLLRFYERQDFRSIGSDFGISEDGARMRVNRALDKLHAALGKNGVTVTATALVTGLTLSSVTAAPAGLASRMAARALAGASGLGFLSHLTRFSGFTGAVKIGAILLVSAAAIALVVTHGGRPSQASAKMAAPGELPRKTSNLVGTVQGSPEPLPVTGKLSANDLESAKRELRSVLTRAQPDSHYAPVALRTALGHFATEWIEAIPILLERTEANDFETRKWALFGIWHLFINVSAFPEKSPTPEIQAQAFALVRPRLSAIFCSESESVELRRTAAKVLMPSWSWRVRRQMNDETMADVISVLQAKDRSSQGFRLELVASVLKPQVEAFPEEGAALKSSLIPLLEQGDSKQQFVAAYALALLPGEKPPGLASILIKALDTRKRDQSHSYLAADALGELGPHAKEAIPALVAFAEQSPNHRQRALEAACRIDPELRREYPEIDERLRQAEAARERYAAPPTISSPGNLGEAFSDPVASSNLLSSLVDQIKRAEDPARERGLVISNLLGVWEKAPANQRANVQQAIDKLQAAPAQRERPRPAEISMRALLVTGRVLLLELEPKNTRTLDELFSQWDAWYREHPAESTATTQRLSDLTASIAKADPVFQKTWSARVLQENPNLDRIIRGELR
jgi:RNA polymerase sigma factor (sigma-70 family)